MADKPKPLDRDRALRWAQMGHVCYLTALMAETRWQVSDVAFQGGTNLHLCWNSPRFSEDLDFLLSREVRDLDEVSRRVAAGVRERFQGSDPAFRVELRDKTRDPERMPVYHLVVSHPGYLGNARIKVEFWRTSPTYLQDYPVTLRTPRAPADLHSVVSLPVPAATLEAAYADKLTALATRPHFKWRDLYDLWWISTQSTAQLDPEATVRQFLHNATAYKPPEGMSAPQALRRFLERDPEALLRTADPDLRRWLPEPLWNALYPEGVKAMVSHARTEADRVITAATRAPEATSPATEFGGG